MTDKRKELEELLKFYKGLPTYDRILAMFDEMERDVTYWHEQYAKLLADNNTLVQRIAELEKQLADAAEIKFPKPGGDWGKIK